MFGGIVSERSYGSCGPHVPFRVHVDAGARPAHSFRRRDHIVLHRGGIDAQQVASPATRVADDGRPENTVRINRQAVRGRGEIVHAGNFYVRDSSGFGVQLADCACVTRLGCGEPDVAVSVRLRIVQAARTVQSGWSALTRTFRRWWENRRHSDSDRDRRWGCCIR